MRTFKNAKYIKDIYSSESKLVGVNVTIDEVVCTIPLDPANVDYAEIMRQVEAGELTIQKADTEENE